MQLVQKLRDQVIWRPGPRSLAFTDSSQVLINSEDAAFFSWFNAQPGNQARTAKETGYGFNTLCSDECCISVRSTIRKPFDNCNNLYIGSLITRQLLRLLFALRF